MSIKNKMIPGVCVVIIFLLISTASCKKQKHSPQNLFQNADTSIYIDLVNNDTYKVVLIGKQWWMAENLKAKKYRDGNPINKIQTDNDLWSNDSIGAYCIYGNNAPGLLYNWYAVNSTNNLAPEGWHIPTDDEWKALELQVGIAPSELNNTNWRGSNSAANKLKKEALLGWQKYTDETWPDNESGFSAVGGGCRLFNGVWGDPGLLATGFWWTATAYTSGNKAWYRYLDYKSTQVFRNYVSKNYGCSVRCVHD